MMNFLEAIGDFLSNLFFTIAHGLNRCGKGIITIYKNINDKSGKKKFQLRDLNFYRRFKEACIRFYLKRTVSFHKKTSIITWQPLVLVLAKTGAGVFISLLFFSLYPQLAGYLKELILFFKLDEIYNFDLPTTSFLETLAQIILLIIIGYSALFYVKYQLEALLSAFVISKSDKKIYYIKNSLFVKELYIFSIPEIDHVVLKQNILSRAAGVGTLLLQKKSGEKVIVSSIKNASVICTQLTALIGPDLKQKESGE